ncbi:MAG: ankyrin repeat domain-containing protein [Anaeroplasmataceae bacterium]|nr:ankyrin repeat domain-containing protein [Anaeroplasmataceae bacterium]MDE7385006.1 ankyrin repeat domain-containing protein [Anaeroplasmataceae bacterium]
MINPFQAILDQNWKQLNSYLEHGNVNVVDAKGMSLLCYAIKLQSNDAVQILLRAYIDVDLADKKGNTSFHYAVLYNRLNYLRVLMTTNGNPMQKNKDGHTPLYLACRYRKEKMIDLYLEKYKLDMGEKDNNEETICMAFVRAKAPLLLKKYGGFEVWLEETNYIGNTPLIVASERDSIAMVKFILEYPVFINMKNHMNETALFYAVKNENKELIDLLLSHGAFLDFKNKNAETIYDIATKEIKEYIEERKRAYKMTTYRRRYPLHYAIYMDDSKLIEKAMTLKNVNMMDSYQFTPLKLATLYHNKQAIDGIKALGRLAKIATLETK